MQVNKSAILTVSAMLVVLASSTGILNATLVSDAEIAARIGAISLFLGLGSIGLFFVGLAFPSNVQNVTNNVALKNVSNQ